MESLGAVRNDELAAARAPLDDREAMPDLKAVRTKFEGTEEVVVRRRWAATSGSAARVTGSARRSDRRRMPAQPDNRSAQAWPAQSSTSTRRSGCHCTARAAPRIAPEQLREGGESRRDTAEQKPACTEPSEQIQLQSSGPQTSNASACQRLRPARSRAQPSSASALRPRTLRTAPAPSVPRPPLPASAGRRRGRARPDTGSGEDSETTPGRRWTSSAAAPWFTPLGLPQHGRRPASSRSRTRRAQTGTRPPRTADGCARIACGSLPSSTRTRRAPVWRAQSSSPARI